MLSVKKEDGLYGKNKEIRFVHLTISINNLLLAVLCYLSTVGRNKQYNYKDEIFIKSGSEYSRCNLQNISNCTVRRN